MPETKKAPGAAEPGAAEPGAAAGGMDPLELLKKEADALEPIMVKEGLLSPEDEGTGGEGPETPEAEGPEGAEGQEPEDAPDVKPIADALDVSVEHARQLYDAAQGVPSLKGKSPEELATVLSEDFEAWRNLEMKIASGEGKPEGGESASGEGDSDGDEGGLFPEGMGSMRGGSIAAQVFGNMGQ